MFYFLFSVTCRSAPGVSVVTGVQSFRPPVGESSSVGTRTPPGSLDDSSTITRCMSSTPISSTPNRILDPKDFSTRFSRFSASPPGLIERVDTELADLTSPMKPLGAAEPKEVRRSSRVSRKP